MNFERGKDPKASLEIGIFSPRVFLSDERATDHILFNIKAINENMEGENLLLKIENYVIQYVKIDNYTSQYDPDWKSMGMGDPSLMGMIAQKLQFYKDEIRERIRS